MAKFDVNKIVDSVVDKANKEFKDDDFKFASKQDFVSNIEWLSSGIYAVNYALTGNAFKGLPFGRTVSMVGDSNSGKSLLSQCFLKETQKMGGIAVLFDVERGIEKNQLVKMGIDVDKLVVSKAKTLEEIFEKAIFFIQAIKDQNKDIPLTIVVDSVSMASSRHEVAEGFDKSDMKRPQVIRKGLRLINSLVADEKVCFIIINHQGANIGVMYGPAKSTMGGCFIPGVEVYTDSGYKAIEDVKVGNKVITHTGQSQEVIRLWEYSDKSNLIKISIDDEEMTVTEEHKFLVTKNGTDYFWEQAKNLTENHSIAKLI